MNETLFAKYCRGRLTEAEKLRLARRLSRPETSRKFAAYVLGWDLLGELAVRREAAIKNVPRVLP